MTSVALDACLCLLLVSAAGVTVTSVPQEGPEPDRADAVTETLAATTVTVDYSLRPVPAQSETLRGSSDDRAVAGPEYERTAHGTLASLLARAAVRTIHVDGEPLSRTNADFAMAVREAVRERLPARTQVVVSYSPYPGSHLRRELQIGPTPPPHADIHAATVRAPSGITSPEQPKTTAERSGFTGLGRRVADVLVSGLFPPEKGRLALAGDPPVDRLVSHRYARASSCYGVQTHDAIADGDTQAANDRLAAAMSERVALELKGRFDSPSEAADTLRLDTVKIAVRTWSA